MLRLGVGQVCVATHTGEAVVCTNVPTHKVPIITALPIIGGIVIAGDLTLGISSVGETILMADSVTWF